MYVFEEEDTITKLRYNTSIVVYTIYSVYNKLPIQLMRNYYIALRFKDTSKKQIFNPI